MTLDDLKDEVMNGPKKRPDELKARLRVVLHDVRYQMAKPEDRHIDEAIAQIDQAYKEEYRAVNYILSQVPVDNKWHGVQFNAKRPGDSIKDMSTYEVMTGQEWYERFKKEAAKVPDGEWLVAPHLNAIKAAKRAAGIDQ